MTSRADAADATRAALLEAAGRLLDDGGPDAVTVRAVGAQAGVTRGAPYGHFDDKQHLLTVIAGASWDAVTQRLRGLRDDPALTASDRLRGAVRGMVDVGLRHPHRYALMFVRPPAHAEIVLDAAAASQDVFLEIVGAAVGEERARTVGALLLAGAHGIANMESSGHLGSAKWGVTADELIDELVLRATLPNPQLSSET
jgi:AcrR family transcriptional regulator